MSIKQFLKPDWRKIMIFVIVSTILSLLPLELEPKKVQGFPLPLYFCMPGGVVVYPEEPRPICGFVDYPYLYLYLVIDILVWYFLSCLIIWIYDKLKKKSP